MNGSTQLIYKAQEVAKQCKVKDSTLRKYSLVLEKEGYRFKKTEQGRRQYTEKDIDILRELIESKEESDITLQEAARLILESKVKEIEDKDITDQEKGLQLNNRKQNKIEKEFESFRKQQEEFNKELLKKLDDQQERQKNRDELLMQTMREVQKNKLLVATTQEKKWWKFWK